MLLLVSAFAFPQSQNEKMAKRFFERTYYSEAIPLYEKVAKDKQSVEILGNLADSYYFTGDFAKAKIWYGMLIMKYRQEAGPEYIFKYVQTLKAAGDYKNANDVYIDYLKKKNKSDLIPAFEKEVHTLENISAIGNRFEILNLPLNTRFSEFGAFPDGDTLVFSGVGRTFGLLDKKYKWNDERYLDLLSIPIGRTMIDTIVTAYNKKLNTVMHEGNAVFTKDGKTIYFTRNYVKNGKRAKNSEKVSVMQIFKADFDGKEWVETASLPFNSTDFSTEHPAISTDGQTLYFSSDMPGGFGSFDLYKVSVNGGVFGIPENLGSNINSEKREQFPFVSTDGKLYFASDGHGGYGSLDVLVADILPNGFDVVKNVGLPVNSGYDDFSFNINSDTKEGYFASNRPGGNGSDDIYRLVETKPLIIEDCSQVIAGTVTDKDSKLPITEATVTLSDGDHQLITTVITAADGAFSFKVGCNEKFTVEASKPLYSKDSRNLSLKEERGKINDASMVLQSDAAKKAAEDLVKEAEKKQQDIVAEEKKKERIANIMAKEKDVVKDGERLLIKTEPIYFDYDLWYIRKESKPILNRVIDLMKKYPEMVVEIGSHTDVRGTFEYNRDLSAKRAASTREYFLEHGIPENRVSAKGYGESKPIIKCVPDDACNEEQHELNRRSEFVIEDL